MSVSVSKFLELKNRLRKCSKLLFFSRKKGLCTILHLNSTVSSTVGYTKAAELCNSIWEPKSMCGCGTGMEQLERSFALHEVTEDCIDCCIFKVFVWGRFLIHYGEGEKKGKGCKLRRKSWRKLRKKTKGYEKIYE